MLKAHKAHIDQDFTPAYLTLLKSGELAKREALAYQHLKDCDLCARYCHVNRCETTRGAVCRTGERAVDKTGVAQHGLVVRHLILPENLSGTDKVLAFIAQEISPNTYLNLMDQYSPCYRADTHPPLDRPITRQEYRKALTLAEQYGLKRLDQRQTCYWLAI